MGCQQSADELAANERELLSPSGARPPCGVRSRRSNEGKDLITEDRKLSTEPGLFRARNYG
jgi:hypothetical protein